MEWNKRRFMTDQYMIVSYGKETQEKEFVCASESPFTEPEFERYKRICEAHGVKLPTEAELADRVGGIHHMLSRKWTDQDINDKIARQNKYKDRVDAKMKAIHANREAENASSGISQNERLAQLNAANRKANAEAVRRAQIAEKKKRLAFQEKKRKADAEARLALEAEATKAKDDGFDDLFGDTKSRSATPGGADTPKEKKKTIIATPRSNGISGFKTLKTKTADEEAFEQLDLGIDIEI
jgi:RNA polymerase-associated protein RTF1